MDPSIVDFVGLKGRPRVTGMPRLAAAFALFAGTRSLLSGLWRRISNITGRRLGGVRGILSCHSQFRFQFSEARIQFLHLGPQLGTLGTSLIR
jgi:hypothetical protein